MRSDEVELWIGGKRIEGVTKIEYSCPPHKGVPTRFRFCGFIILTGLALGGIAAWTIILITIW